MLNEEIKKSWEKNAQEWIKIIDNELIESRKFTNQAIIESVLKYNPKNALDLGCGEGWLTRELSETGIRCTGIDASSGLIENARKKGEGNFLNFSYEELTNNPEIPGKPFDAVVINFSLFLKEETRFLLKNLRSLLSENGIIHIQTLHPYFIIKNSLPYKSQWIEDSWAGLKGDFTDPHSWYVRTFSDWVQLFNSVDFKLIDLKEPLNNENQPISVIFGIKPFHYNS